MNIFKKIVAKLTGESYQKPFPEQRGESAAERFARETEHEKAFAEEQGRRQQERARERLKRKTEEAEETIDTGSIEEK
jgi:tellurite resistance protein